MNTLCLRVQFLYDSNFATICSELANWQLASIGSGKTSLCRTGSMMLPEAIGTKLCAMTLLVFGEMRQCIT